MQVSSSKDKNPVIKDMSFYGLIQEIWELNYNTFDVPSLHTMDILMDDFNEELGVGELNTTFGIEDEEKEIGTGNEILKQMKRPQESTIMFDVTRIKCLGEKKVVRYNEDGAIGKEVEQININDNEAEFDIFKERALIQMPKEGEVVCE
ncbi:transposase [Cucumis melo var. makuwa]|uniref:Transposase n=1 Tax=Cucumis melo var. makuwa TaxID=1194695 RepID=A0A5D3E448_CUCMM|nr:transposase [Cucumis melo var. makuwa]